MTAIYAPVVDMTRQTLPRDTAAGAFLEADDAPHHHHFHSSNVVSPLSLPPPRVSFTWSPVPLAATTRPTAISTQLPTSSHLAPSTSRPQKPGGAKFRSVSASPVTRSRYSNHHLSHAATSRPSLVSPPSSTGRSASTSDRTKLLAMEAEKISWEAEKAGYKRHIEVLEEKLKEAMLENEDLRERLDAVINGERAGDDDLMEVQEEEPDMSQEESMYALSPVTSRGRGGPSTFVPHDNIPGAAFPATTTTTTCDRAVVETHLDTVTSPGGTKTSETTVSATVFHSEKLTQPSGAPSLPGAAEPPTETMDVSTIDPELEGIRLKAAAIQKPTFSISQASPPLDSVVSPPLAEGSNSSTAGSGSEGVTSPPPKMELNFAVRKSSKAQTLHVLATAESGRRKMHAGHTPSHSVSHFPVPVAEEVAEAALGAAQEAAQELASQEVEGHPDDAMDEHEGDNPLRGHLMAQSDGTPSVFLDEFTKKLEDIRSGAEDGVPSVLRNPRIPLDDATAAVEVDVVGTGGGGVEESRPDVEVLEQVEIDTEVDIPLKLKTTTNFGLPWGQLGGRPTGRATSSDLFAANG